MWRVFGLVAVLGACRRSAIPPAPGADAGVGAAPSAAPSPTPTRSAIPSPKAAASTPAATPKLDVPVPADPSPYHWKLASEGLPAVSADGERVAVVLDLLDGGRGYPSSELVVLAVDKDQIERRLALFVPDEFSSPSGAPDAKKLSERLGRARAELAKTSWAPVAHEKSTLRPGTMTYEWGPIDGAKLSLANGHLRVRAVGTTLLDQDVHAWRVPPYTVRGFSPCQFEPLPELLGVDRVRRVVLVVVSQIPTGGGDQCEISNTPHAYRLREP